LGGLIQVLVASRNHHIVQINLDYRFHFAEFIDSQCLHAHAVYELFLLKRDIVQQHIAANGGHKLGILLRTVVSDFRVQGRQQFVHLGQQRVGDETPPHEFTIGGNVNRLRDTVVTSQHLPALREHMLNLVAPDLLAKNLTLR
jgi:hypothetical protein